MQNCARIKLGRWASEKTGGVTKNGEAKKTQKKGKKKKKKKELSLPA